MYSFGYQCENDDNMNTPFFEDDLENHSIFNTDVQTEFNAYDLFNSSENYHQQSSSR
jgi:peptide methionine sulfoxide reductase MsrA